MIEKCIEGYSHMKVKDPKSAFSTSESTPIDELRELCFPRNGLVMKTATIQSKSGDNDSADSNLNNNINTSGISKPFPITAAFIRSKEARQGRNNQRWATCGNTGDTIRLCTGSVPITSNGHIMCVSSSKKKQWILPKGGWELDETLEQCAVRETFEEGGVFGVLGPQLNAVTFETRKSQMKKISLNENKVKTEGVAIAINSSHNTSSKNAETRSKEKPMNGDDEKNLEVKENSIEKKENIGSHMHKETGLPEEISAPLCRIHYFPLYVTDAYSDWPESGRTRKVFTIDDAITTITRKEMKQALTEVKERGLHLCGSTYIAQHYQTQPLDEATKDN